MRKSVLKSTLAVINSTKQLNEDKVNAFTESLKYIVDTPSNMYDVFKMIKEAVEEEKQLKKDIEVLAEALLYVTKSTANYKYKRVDDGKSVEPIMHDNDDSKRKEELKQVLAVDAFDILEFKSVEFKSILIGNKYEGYVDVESKASYRGRIPVNVMIEPRVEHPIIEVEHNGILYGFGFNRRSSSLTFSIDGGEIQILPIPVDESKNYDEFKGANYHSIAKAQLSTFLESILGV